jgi:hypothetical protein
VVRNKHLKSVYVLGKLLFNINMANRSSVITVACFKKWMIIKESLVEQVCCLDASGV